MNCKDIDANCVCDHERTVDLNNCALLQKYDPTLWYDTMVLGFYARNMRVNRNNCKRQHCDGKSYRF